MKTVKLNDKLSLENDGELSLFFIGVGSAFTKTQNQTNLLIIKGKDHILIDCGTKCCQALHNMGSPVTNISNFLITHSHADHCGGLEEVGLMYRYVLQKKPNIVITKDYQEILWNFSLAGGSSFNEYKNGMNLRFEDYWNVIRPEPMNDMPRETFQIKIGSIDLKIFRTNHIPDDSPNWEKAWLSYGILIDDRVLFPSDTKFDSELITSFNNKYNIDTIFHDVQFFPGGVHAPLEELKTLPEDIKKKTWLVHYGDNFESFTEKILDYGFAGFGKSGQYYIFD